MVRYVRFAVVALVAWTAGISSAVAAPASAAQAMPLDSFPTERLALETRGSFKRILFDAWRADSPARREQGLMFVRDEQMRPDQAMIFVYDPPAYVSMWMKNTLLSLDMLFTDANGCIFQIKRGATPGSLEQIAARKPVALVVELKSGTVERHRIDVGDRVIRTDWQPANGDDGFAGCRPEQRQPGT